MIGGVPVATTVKVAVCPALTIWLEGCDVIDGGEFTVKVEALLVALPKLFVTTTAKLAPLSVAVVGCVV